MGFLLASRITSVHGRDGGMRRSIQIFHGAEHARLRHIELAIPTRKSGSHLEHYAELQPGAPNPEDFARRSLCR